MNNPNKVNQYTDPDPRQALFLSYYLDPKSETFSNCLQSGLKAGFSQEYSENLLNIMPKWLSESIESSSLLHKAEKRLNQLLDFEPVDQEGKIDNALLSNQMKGITLIAKGLGKAKYSERTETDITTNGKEILGINYIIPDGNKFNSDN